MGGPHTCEEARRAFAARRWREAYDLLSSADAEARIAAGDLERYAAAAYLIGEERAALDLWARLHHDCAERGEADAAARWACWIALLHLLGGRLSQAAGWRARARRLLPADGPEGPAAGFGHVIDGLTGEAGTSPTRRFDAAIALATRCRDPDLLTIGLLSRGQALIADGRIREGVELLDEAMVTVTSGAVAPVLAGVVYCAVILTCQTVFDFERAVQWTRELDAWCAAQPDLAPYRGQCLVHRSEVLQANGDWPSAEREADRALAHLGGAKDAVVGRAFYQRGDLHRLRGAFEPAAKMYREARLRGFPPQPGAALLLLAEGRAREARDAVLAALGDAAGGPRRLRLLGPCVEILVASGDLEAARDHAEELSARAAAVGAPLLDAVALDARGRLLLAERKPQAARTILREAQTIWRRLNSPYQAARTGMALGEAQLALGEPATARGDIEAARDVFARLAAGPDLARAERLLAPRRRADGLTAREAEVLARVASGETNRQIAAALAISRHTVARHLSNIFDKTGACNRTEASVYAQRSGLV